MPDWLTLHIVALLLLAALFGGMLAFMAVFTPLAFARLPAETAGAFIRSVFPVYYRVCGILSLLAALPLVPAHAYMAEVATLVLVAGGFVLANAVLRPAAERARAEGRDARFRRLHRVSVLLHLVQFGAVTIVLVRLAQ
jgi:Domain of unknown function (DUF4149)